MDNDKIVRIAAVGFIGLVVVPAVVGITCNLIYNTGVVICNAVNKSKYNKKIKKGLEDGSIVEIDGTFYEVEKNVEKEA